MAKVLLVVGNGFDLACGLKSSFKKYLESEYYKDIYDSIKKLETKLTEDLKYPSEYDGYSLYSNYKFDFSFDNITFWDVYFVLSKIEEIYGWCDFERCIKKFICEFIESDEIVYEDIYNIKVKRNTYKDNDFKFKFIINNYIKETHIKDIDLFKQLKEYEKRFGEYIKLQQNNHKDYNDRANLLVEKMLDKRNDDVVTYINTFNYSDLSFLCSDIWHINGDNYNPIFGIDLPEVSPINKKYKYTKTYRRLELSGKEVYYPKNKKYNKVIVYGHSLNEQDYSYFFSLFNILNLNNDRFYNNNTDKYIEFVYNKYNGKSSEEARQEIVSRVLKMFYAYNNEILGQRNFRLIDILFSSGAIRFKEIDG